MPGNDSFTKLLLHCDGADASTTFTDSSSAARAMTAVGNAQIDTAQSVFGGASGLFDGTGDGVSALDAADLEIGSSDFTLDVWARLNTLPAATYAFFQKGTGAASNLSYAFYVQSDGGGGYNLGFLSTTNGTTGTTNTQTWAPSTATWYHLAVTRKGSTLRFFVNGTKLGTDMTNSDTFFDGTATLVVGANSAGGNSMDGWLDEARLSNGVARWTSGFPPPTAPYDAVEYGWLGREFGTLEASVLRQRGIMIGY